MEDDHAPDVDRDLHREREHWCVRLTCLLPTSSLTPVLLCRHRSLRRLSLGELVSLDDRHRGRTLIRTRQVFPADCCPSAYVKLSKFSRRQVDFIEDDEPVVNTPPPADDEEDEPLPDPVPIEAPPVEEPATVTVTSGEASTTQTVLTTLFEPRPEVPVSSIVYAYKGTTVTAATPTVSTTRTITQEAATPLVTVKTTRVILAEAPIQTERTTAPTPTTTVTVTSTSTLATPLATTTSTSYAQPTACVQKVRLFPVPSCLGPVLVVLVSSKDVGLPV